MAGAAVAVVDDGLHAHAVSDGEVCHAFADLLDYAAELMAKGQGNGLAGDGVGCGRADAGAADVLVQICQWSVGSTRRMHDGGGERCY